jgi:hypothetical protein
MATAARPYAGKVGGNPIVVPFNAGATVYKAGDVVVVGNCPFVFSQDLPAFTGGTVQDSVSVMDGIYTCMADGAISPGNDVWWDATNKKVTLTAAGNKHFGKCVAGPAGGLEGVGPAADGDTAYVLHCPALIASGTNLSTAQIITDTSAASLAVGANGNTNPGFVVDDSTGSAVTGLKIKAGATGTGVALSTISSATNDPLKIDAKGTGTIVIGGVSTGQISIGRGVLAGVIESLTKTVISAQSGTPSAAVTIGGYINHVSATGAGTLTFVSGTTLSAAIVGVAVGDSFTLNYANTGNQTVTLTGATGTTIIGTAAVPTGKNATINFVNTGTNTWDVLCSVSA